MKLFSQIKVDMAVKSDAKMAKMKKVIRVIFPCCKITESPKRVPCHAIWLRHQPRFSPRTTNERASTASYWLQH